MVFSMEVEQLEGEQVHGDDEEQKRSMSIKRCDRAWTRSKLKTIPVSGW